MNPILRPYQSDLISRIFYQWQTHRRILAQLPTGGGKSVIFGAIASQFVRAGLRVLLIAHREELILQAHSHLSHWCECGIGIIKAGYPETPLFPVQVASVQSLVNRLDRVGHFDLIIIDEAHHTTAVSYRTILDNFPNAKILGLTATPVRLDGTGFDDLFDVLECGLGTAELIQTSYLSPFKMYADPNPMIVKGVRSIGGDYSLSQLAKVNDSLEVAGHLVNSYRRYAKGLQTVIFAINIEHSESIACTFNLEGIPTAHLDGESDSAHRKRTLERFKAGKIQVLTNVGLFDEGVDIPTLECLMLARPTKSLSRYLQMCGRVLRIAEGKTHGLIIDMTKSWATHGLPDFPRKWQLEGMPPSQQELEVDDDLEVKVKVKPERLIPLADALPLDRELMEVTGEGAWDIIYADLVVHATEKGYKAAWIRFRLEELKPPLTIWTKYAQMMKYKPGWAFYRWQEQQRGMAA